MAAVWRALRRMWGPPPYPYPSHDPHEVSFQVWGPPVYRINEP